MNTTNMRPLRYGLLTILAGLGLAAALWYWNPGGARRDQAPQPPAPGTNLAQLANKPDTAPGTNAPPPAPAATNAPGATNVAAASAPAPGATNAPALTNAATAPLPEKPLPPGAKGPPGETEVLSPTNEIQLSFQGANVDMVVQWLAKNSGKSVVKHPKVQCQLTIVSSKKMTAREALNVVYRALALEGFTVIESSKSILIVPEGQEPKLSPELVDSSHAGIPDGRQRLVKIFPLKYVQPAELKDKVRAILSEKATVEVSDRSQQLVVTDYNDNLRMLGELIKELDIPASGDSDVQFFTLKYAEAEDLGYLLGMILNSQPAPPPSPSSSPSSSPSRSSSPFSSRSESMSVSSSSSSSPPPPAPAPSSGAPGAQPVRIWPDKVANRLIVAAPKSKFPDIQKLITTLDTAKPQDVTVRVLPLKNASAEELVRELGPLYQKMGGKSVKEAVEIAANTRANSLVVLSSEINFKAIEKLITTLDTDEAQEKIMRAFTLKNADAEDVAKQLRDLQQDSQSSSSPFRIFYFSDYPSGGRGGPKKPTIVADRRRNTVIVQAPPAQMETLAKMIQTLDEPVEDDGLAPRIFRLKYVSASDIEDVLNELFMKKQQQRQYWDYYYGSPPEDTSDRQGRLFGKVRITSEPYSNSIIVSGNSTESLTAVEDMLKQLDVPSQAGDTTLRIGLKFAKATTVANSVNILFAKGGSPPLRPVAQPAQGNDASRPNQQPPSYSQSSFGLEQEQKEEGYFPWLGGQPESYYRSFDGRSAVLPVSDLVGRVRVVADRRSNSLLVTAKMHYFPQVIKLIDELDAPTPQVMIEAKIIEVASDFREKLGVRWSQDPTSFDAEDLDNAIAIKNTASYNKVFAGSALANSLQTGILDSSVNLNVLIQFLQKNIDSKVLAEPQINIADNEMGKLFVGSQVPFIDRSLQTDVGGLNQSFSYKDVGIILEVTPHINDDGEVALKIRAESSSIRPGEKVFGGLILDTRNFRTDLMVKNGQTIVLGGILQRAQQDTLRKTPFLGSIPGLGWLFKKKDNLAREVELMVFLRPQVIRTPEEAKRLKEEAEKKSPLIQKWDNENLENTQKKSETK